MTKQQRNTEKEIIREELVELKLHYEIDDEKLKEKFKMGKRGFLLKIALFLKPLKASAGWTELHPHHIVLRADLHALLHCNNDDGLAACVNRNQHRHCQGDTRIQPELSGACKCTPVHRPTFPVWAQRRHGWGEASRRHPLSFDGASTLYECSYMRVVLACAKY